MSTKMTSSSFSYTITDVPDYDQQWQFLPGQGKMYCLPTAAMNWLNYIADHGWSRAVPLVTDRDPVLITMNLSVMAAYMKTDPIEDSIKAHHGLVDYLDDFSVPGIVVTGVATDSDYISLADLQSLAMLRGFVVLTYGRYEGLEEVYLARTGGHALSLVGLEVHGSEGRIEYRNPGDEQTDLVTQSARARAHKHVKTETWTLEGESLRALRMGDRKQPYEFIDGFLAIQPLFAITSPADSTSMRNEVLIHKASFESTSTETTKGKTPFKGDLVDLAINPAATSASMIARGDNAVWRLDLAQESWTKVITSSEPQLLTYGGRDRRLFVVQGKEVESFDRVGKPLGKIDTAVEVGAISYDQKNDRVILAASSSKRLLALSPALKLLEDTEAPDVSGTGRLTMSVNGRDATIFLSREGAPDVATLRWHSTGARATGKFRVMADGRTSARHIDPKGRLIAVENGKIANFDSDGNRLRNAWFEGLSAGRLLKVARSSHNFDPVRTQKKEWKN